MWRQPSPLRLLTFLAAIVCSLAMVFALHQLAIWQAKPALADPTGPAGISSGLKLWFTASNGVKSGASDAADGQNVTAWEDQSVDARNATGTGAEYSAEGLNFNPTLEFNDNNYTFDLDGLPDGNEDRSIFVVASNNDTGSWRYVLGAGTFGGNAGFDFGNQAGSGTVFITTHNAQEASTSSWQPVGTARLAYGAVTSGTLYVAVNGGGLVAGGSGVNTTLDSAGNIGANSGGAEQWNGSISEVIMYDRTVTPTERQRINSYLALKYGFSLDQSTAQSYLATGSALMWDKDASGAGTYDNGLFGIGRDDASGLSQIKSLGQTATNVLTIEADDEGTNLVPDFDDIADLEFLVIGDNNGDDQWTTTGAPTGYSILERQWKKQEQGDVGDVFMSFAIDDSDFNIPTALGDGDYYFIYDTDNDGSLADETPQAMNSGASTASITINLGAGSLFTLASSDLPALNVALPSDNNTSVHLTTSLSMEFSRAVTAGAGSIKLYKYSDNSLVQTIAANSAAVEIDGAYVTVDINDLINLTGYYILIDTNAFQDDGDYFPGISNKDSWNFTTIAEDVDTDGVGNDQEQAAPNGGDGNGDSIADSEQESVASLPNTIAGEEAYLTLEAEGQCTQLSDVAIIDHDDLDTGDQGFSYPLGLVDFQLICDDPGDSAQVTVYFDQEYDVDDWQIRKLINEVYSEVADAELSTAVIGSTTVTTLSYELVDGGDLDADGLVDGNIVDPIGPAVLAAVDPSPTPTLSSSPAPTTPAAEDSAGLPSTGAMVKMTGIFGLLLIVSGLALRSTTRRRPS